MLKLVTILLSILNVYVDLIECQKIARYIFLKKTIFFLGYQDIFIRTHLQLNTDHYETISDKYLIKNIFGSKYRQVQLIFILIFSFTKYFFKSIPLKKNAAALFTNSQNFLHSTRKYQRIINNRTSKSKQRCTSSFPGTCLELVNIFNVNFLSLLIIKV